MTVEFKVLAFRDDGIQSPDMSWRCGLPLPLPQLSSPLWSPLEEVKWSSNCQLPLGKDQHLFLQ